MQNVPFNRSLKAMVVANIAVIISSIVALIWNFAVMTQRIETIQTRLDHNRELYQAISSQVYDNAADVQVLQNGQVLMDGRVLRLEELHLNGDEGSPAPGG